jgi:hypothetical protein
MQHENPQKNMSVVLKKQENRNVAIDVFLKSLGCYFYDAFAKRNNTQALIETVRELKKGHLW